MVSEFVPVKNRMVANYFYLYFGSKIYQLVYELIIVDGQINNLVS